MLQIRTPIATLKSAIKRRSHCEIFNKSNHFSKHKMPQFQATTKLLCLLFLVGGCHLSLAEEFPQCADVELDTFVKTMEDCTSYIYCNGENSFRDSCPEQTYFDAKAQECAFDDEGVCLQPMVVVTTESSLEITVHAENETIEELQTETTAAAPAPTPAGDRPHCDVAGDDYYPHRQRCEYYYSCIGGYLTIVRCPYKYGWDYAENQCKPLSQAKCLNL